MKPAHRLARLMSVLSCALTACSRAPSIDVLGSFFPVWMICTSIAVILTFFSRMLLLRFKLESHIGPVGLFYPSLVILFSCLLWLISFR